MKKLQRFLSRYSLHGVAAIASGALLGMLFFYGATTFLPLLSASEKEYIVSTQSLRAILENPLWLPHKLVAYTLQTVTNNPMAVRYASGIFAILTLIAVFSLLNRWFKGRVAMLTVVLFGISSSMLTLGRSATPAILLFSWIIVVAIAVWFRFSRHTKIATTLTLPILALLLYVPGTAWFVLPVGVLLFRQVLRSFKHIDTMWLAIGGLLATIVALPLISALLQNDGFWRQWLLLPDTFTTSGILQQLRSIPAAYFFRTPALPAYNLAQLPWLDALSSALCLLGLYAFKSHLRLARVAPFVLALIVASTLTILNRNVLYTLFALPFMYLFAAYGIWYLLREWRSVFPRNPFARFVGTTILSVAVLAASLYHMNRYFVAWQNTPETRSVYGQSIE